MAGIIFTLSPPEALAKFCIIVESLFEILNEITPEVLQKLQLKAHELGVNPLDCDHTLWEIIEHKSPLFDELVGNKETERQLQCPRCEALSKSILAVCPECGWEFKYLINETDDSEKTRQYHQAVAVAADQNNILAVRRHRKAAEQGKASSQAYLGYAYVQGKGFDQNNEEAVKWYRKAAEQGHSVAQNNLGCAYTHGEGVDEDKTEAAKWYRKAAEQGLAGAQYNLGGAYFSGIGVDEDKTEAAKWYRKAAEQGHAVAQICLGYAYGQGKGVDQNNEEAVKWYRKAAEQGHAVAQICLGSAYTNGEGVDEDKTEAAKWYRKAAEQGNAEAQYTLGYAYDYGEGVDEDKTEAAKWYCEAAGQGNSKAGCAYMHLTMSEMSMDGVNSRLRYVYDYDEANEGNEAVDSAGKIEKIDEAVGVRLKERRIGGTVIRRRKKIHK